MTLTGDALVIDEKFTDIRKFLIDKDFFKANVGMIDIKLALPHLSPKPLIVPCTCLTPAWIAASELATAFSVSLWA